jgi:LssY-like putative type I secretion system component LssY
VKVDRSTKEALIHGLLASLSKEAYVQMPMSTLTLFGRPQDYGYAHADPLAVVATRHHLRIWKTPYQVDGQRLWAGAGTHDMGFERDQRSGGITHHIDPAIDGERDFIGQSLNATGRVAKMGYVSPSDPLTTANTATGESFHSDGRILVMMLRASTRRDRSVAFADLFCGVLLQEHPDEGNWGDCSQYLETPPSSRTALLPPIPTKYRMLILPGIFNPCVSSTPAFGKGQEHLRQTHGLTVEYLTLPNASSESNGELIADYLKTHVKNDSRKYIVVSYSKGAPDFQVGIAQHPEAAAAVAAFVTVAGAVGGSPIADVMPEIAKRYIDALHLGSCQGDLAEAFKSLRANARHAFLLSHPNLPVRSYSLVALSDQADTSKLLQQAWQLLGVYGTAQDSQLLREDAILPGATYLGAARADHLAVALPFEDLNNSESRALMDHNHYPRSALLEAVVRFAIQDLEKPQ